MTQRKIKVRGVYRSGSHLPIWEVLQQARIWQKAGLELAEFRLLCDAAGRRAGIVQG